MTLDALKERVRAANVETVARGLVISTFGNVSGADRAAGRIAIKPSGVPYDALTAEQIVLTTMDGVPQDNRFKPSSDLATHVVLYGAFEGIGGVVHTHSTYATIFAQAGRPIPCLGTTHADYFRGPVPVTRALRPDETGADYVAATGRVIVEAFAGRDPGEVPAALVQGHGPFVWGETPEAAVENAFLLEEIARMAYLTLTLAPAAPAITDHLRDRHYLRKHGAAATYGQ
ncbi:L-ribulose-5-phosphate 4-epimerase AraD [Acuticoccus yangtzensis]|uniref:L-ribulose-5-phosphate 4-epimerase AraD n=1 Tax=Acuticoccus yangtzensis TaxID=1443441 RepID=UPI0009497B9F|nr:L-ribulose-5-phosphate 4-epimerase AraD [Acuticoccus yangtzensis]ORE94294.1 class II aldolase/adducin family protein [Stappia sp. 22II-S9-Z10]